MAAEDTVNSPIKTDRQATERERRVSALLADKDLRVLLVQKLKEDGFIPKGTTWDSMKGVKTATGQIPTSGANWPAFPTPFPFMPFPAAPFWGPFHTSASPVVGTGVSYPSKISCQYLQGSAPLSSLPGSSRSQGQGVEDRPSSSCSQSQEDEDFVELLDEEESLELVQFDPTIPDKNAWEAGEIINSFIEKHFKHTITAEERNAIMEDFPKPSCTALCTPKLDEDIKKQIRMAGRDPHFGVEKHLFKLQDQILDMAGPLTCPWTDLLDQNITVKLEEIILLLQRVLVLLGSTSFNITQERRRVALSRVNPTIKSLPRHRGTQGERKDFVWWGIP